MTGRVSHVMSRLATSAVVIAAALVIMNLHDVASGVVNAPSYFGAYDRRPGIAYGDLRRQSLDVYVPRGGANHPVVVFWHGGTWMRGSKEEVRFVGVALAEAGYVAILPNYRLRPQVRFPDFLDDGALAVKWAREHAREFSGDPNAIFVMGHSAGGYLAAMLALDEGYLAKVGGDAGWIRGWIGLSAPYEMPGDLVLARAFLGVTGAAKWRPIDLVSEGAPPALLIHGLEDRSIHPREVASIQKKLASVSVPADCRIHEDAGHLAPVLSLSLPTRSEAVTLAQVRAFIDGAIAGTLGRGTPCPSLEGRKVRSYGPVQIPYRTPRRDHVAANN